MKIIDILDQLAADPSRLAKEAILNKNKNNAELKEAIRLSLDSLTQFHIRKIPVYTRYSKGNKTLTEAFDMLKELQYRRVTGHNGIAHLKEILENVDSKDAQVIERIIAKDLRCGVAASTANKIWEGLVPEFPCMLASGYEEKLVNKITFPAYAQLKLDGMRATMVVVDGNVDVYSRNGKLLNMHDALSEAIESLFLNYFAIDGELLVMNEDGTMADRKTGNGILNKAVKGTMSVEESKMIKFVVFDLIPLDDFRKEKCVHSYEARYQSLKYIFSQMKKPAKEKLELVKTWEVDSAAGAVTVFLNALERGEEGIILKDKSGIWENKRSKSQIKFKAEQDCDLLCVGVDEGTGKNVGRMGALVLESADGVIKVSVGTGFSDEDRINLWKNKPIDKVVAIGYNMRIEDKAGNQSLFLPKFLEIREDKTKADTSKVIK